MHWTELHSGQLLKTGCAQERGRAAVHGVQASAVWARLQRKRGRGDSAGLTAANRGLMHLWACGARAAGGRRTARHGLPEERVHRHLHVSTACFDVLELDPFLPPSVAATSSLQWSSHSRACVLQSDCAASRTVDDETRQIVKARLDAGQNLRLQQCPGIIRALLT